MLYSHKWSEIQQLIVLLHMSMPHSGNALTLYERTHLGNVYFEIIFQTLNLHNFLPTTPFFSNFISLESCRRDLQN